jgi:hypothetical protein
MVLSEKLKNLIVTEYNKSEVLSFDTVRTNLDISYIPLSKIREAYKQIAGEEKFLQMKKTKQRAFNSKKGKERQFVKCKLCNKEFKTNLDGGATKHLKTKHFITENINNYLENIEVLTKNYAKYKYIQPADFTCKICGKEYYDRQNKSGQFTLHLIQVHQIKIHDYVKLYPEHSYLFERKIKRSKENQNDDLTFSCRCGMRIKKMTQQHLDKFHDGIRLKDFAKTNQTVSPYISRLLSENAIEVNKTMISNSISKCEEQLAKKLHIHEIQFRLENRYFDYKIDNDLIEIDGNYWHAKNITNNFYADQFINLANDVYKNHIAEKNGYNLYRIWEDNIDNIKTIGDLKNASYDKDYNIDFFDSILKKPYNLSKKDELVKAFIIYTNLQYPDIITDRDVHTTDVTSCIQLNNYSLQADNSITGKSDDTFYSWLYFREFYNSKMINSRSMYENYSDKKVSTEVFKWMLDNNKDISRYSFLTNMKFYRKTGVSTFSHSLTYFILDYIRMNYINKINTIYDPFAGWGNRLVGFWLFDKDYSVSKVISNDLNELTAEDNKNLGQALLFDKAEITNFDACQNKVKADVVFSCPPYYDFENYNVREFDQVDLYKLIDILPEKAIKCFVVNLELMAHIQQYVKTIEILNISKRNKVEFCVIWQ